MDQVVRILGGLVTTNTASRYAFGSFQDTIDNGNSCPLPTRAAASSRSFIRTKRLARETACRAEMQRTRSSEFDPENFKSSSKYF